MLEHEVLEMLQPDGWDVLLAMAPPRHGKSWFCSRAVPQWYHCVHPDDSSILASYGLDLARFHSRAVRDGVHRLGPHYDLAGIDPNASAASEWRIQGHEGGMKAAGIGGGITGRGANLFIVDDYLKNDKQAVSEKVRESQWSWFQTTAFTRIEPGGKLIVLACLVGDTAVSMADGTTKTIRDVRPGDMVQTCNGALESRKIVNHACVGHDNVFKIVLESGREVRANARHPFMALRQGQLQWIRLRNLRRNDVLITASHMPTEARKDSGECMSECFASGTRGATSKPTARAIALSTTFDNDCEMASGHRLTTLSHTGKPGSSIGTASQSSNMTRWSMNRMESVQPVENHQQLQTCESTKGFDCSWTTATTQERLEDSSAITVTLQQDIQEQPPMLLDWLSISDFTSDRIVSIEPDGFEPVYDIEVEDTGNFIANGIVSHNTRWHEDDLIGKLVKFMVEDARLKVREIRLPALAEPTDTMPDMLGRQTDEALWPSRWSAEALMKIRDVMEPYWWNAMYQQRLGSYGRNEWPQEYFYGCLCQEDEWPEGFALSVTALDPSKGKNSKAGDYSAIVTVGFKNGYLWIDADIERRPVPQMMTDLVSWNEQHRPTATGIEAVAFQELLGESYRQAQLELGNYRDEPILIENNVNKQLRIGRLGVWLRLHRVKIRRNKGGLLLLKQLKEFPNAEHDDGPDAMEMAVRELLKLSQALNAIQSGAIHAERMVP